MAKFAADSAPALKVGDLVRLHPAYETYGNVVLRITDIWEGLISVKVLTSANYWVPKKWHRHNLIPLTPFESLLYETLDS